MKKPSVPRHWLFFIAGTLWMIAGFILIERAYGWLTDFDTGRLIITLALSIVLGLVFYFGGFIKTVRKNTNRIKSLPEDVCLFAFTAWKGYIIIAVMVAGGILIRNSAFPKHYLALLYNAMGVSLLIGGSRFFASFISNRKHRK